MKSMDDNKAVAVVLLDLSAAFDTVEHYILLNRLLHTYGIVGRALDWIASYLWPSIPRLYRKCNIWQSDAVPLHSTRLSGWATFLRLIHMLYYFSSLLFFSFVNVIRFSCVKRHSFLMRLPMRHSYDRVFYGLVRRCGISPICKRNELIACHARLILKDAHH